MMKTTVVFATLMMLLFGAVAMGDAGYFARVQPNDAKWIPAGALGDPGPAVEIVSVNVVPGTYLITARVDGYSYSGNSGAGCYIATPSDPYGGQNMGQNLNTSGDGVYLAWDRGVILGQTTVPIRTVLQKVSIICQRGYSFTGSTNVFGALMLVRVN